MTTGDMADFCLVYTVTAMFLQRFCNVPATFMHECALNEKAQEVFFPNNMLNTDQEKCALTDHTLAAKPIMLSKKILSIKITKTIQKFNYL